MLPGKANTVPVPIMFLSKEVRKACASAHQGPSKTPETRLIKCCIGAILAAPILNSSTLPPMVPNADKRAVKTRFRNCLERKIKDLQCSKTKEVSKTHCKTFPSAGVNQIKFKGPTMSSQPATGSPNVIELFFVFSIA